MLYYTTACQCIAHCVFAPLLISWRWKIGKFFHDSTQDKKKLASRPSPFKANREKQAGAWR